jgi:hypothetical protein
LNSGLFTKFEDNQIIELGIGIKLVEAYCNIKQRKKIPEDER